MRSAQHVLRAEPRWKPTVIVGLPAPPSPFVMVMRFAVPVSVRATVVFSAVRAIMPFELDRGA